MSDGKWSGGTTNRGWARPGNRYRGDGMTAAQRHALYLSVAGELFLCDTCDGLHPLREHRECRAEHHRKLVAGLLKRGLSTGLSTYPHTFQEPLAYTLTGV